MPRVPRRQSSAREGHATRATHGLERYVRSREEAGGASAARRVPDEPASRVRVEAPVLTPPSPSNVSLSPAGRSGQEGRASQLPLLKVAPWKITGPASHPEWKEVPIGAEEYRVVAPACVHPPPRPPAPPSDQKTLPGAPSSEANLPAPHRRRGFAISAPPSPAPHTPNRSLISPSPARPLLPQFSARDRPRAVVRARQGVRREIPHPRHSPCAREGAARGYVRHHGGDGGEVAAGIEASGGAVHPPGVRHGSQDPGAAGSAYAMAEHLDNTNGGYTG